MTSTLQFSDTCFSSLSIAAARWPSVTLHGHQITSTAYCVKTNVVATGCDSGLLYLWRIKKDELGNTLFYPYVACISKGQRESRIVQCHFVRWKSTVLMGLSVVSVVVSHHVDGLLRFWSVEDGRCLLVICTTSFLGAPAVFSRTLCDNRFLVIASILSILVLDVWRQTPCMVLTFGAAMKEQSLLKDQLATVHSLSTLRFLAAFHIMHMSNNIDSIQSQSKDISDAIDDDDDGDSFLRNHPQRLPQCRFVAESPIVALACSAGITRVQTTTSFSSSRSLLVAALQNKAIYVWDITLCLNQWIKLAHSLQSLHDRDQRIFSSFDTFHNIFTVDPYNIRFPATLPESIFSILTVPLQSKPLQRTGVCCRVDTSHVLAIDEHCLASLSSDATSILLIWFPSCDLFQDYHESSKEALMDDCSNQICGFASGVNDSLNSRSCNRILRIAVPNTFKATPNFLYSNIKDTRDVPLDASWAGLQVIHSVKAQLWYSLTPLDHEFESQSVPYHEETCFSLLLAYTKDGRAFLYNLSSFFVKQSMTSDTTLPCAYLLCTWSMGVSFDLVLERSLVINFFECGIGDTEEFFCYVMLRCNTSGDQLQVFHFGFDRISRWSLFSSATSLPLHSMWGTGSTDASPIASVHAEVGSQTSFVHIDRRSNALKVTHPDPSFSLCSVLPGQHRDSTGTRVKNDTASNTVAQMNIFCQHRTSVTDEAQMFEKESQRDGSPEQIRFLRHVDTGTHGGNKCDTESASSRMESQRAMNHSLNRNTQCPSCNTSMKADQGHIEKETTNGSSVQRDAISNAPVQANKSAHEREIHAKDGGIASLGKTNHSAHCLQHSTLKCDHITPNSENTGFPQEEAMTLCKTNGTTNPVLRSKSQHVYNSSQTAVMCVAPEEKVVTKDTGQEDSTMRDYHLGEHTTHHNIPTEGSIDTYVSKTLPGDECIDTRDDKSTHKLNISESRDDHNQYLRRTSSRDLLEICAPGRQKRNQNDILKTCRLFKVKTLAQTAATYDASNQLNASDSSSPVDRDVTIGFNGRLQLRKSAQSVVTVAITSYYQGREWAAESSTPKSTSKRAEGSNFNKVVACLVVLANHLLIGGTLDGTLVFWSLHTFNVMGCLPQIHEAPVALMMNLKLGDPASSKSVLSDTFFCSIDLSNRLLLIEVSLSSVPRIVLQMYPSYVVYKWTSPKESYDYTADSVTSNGSIRHSHSLKTCSLDDHSRTTALPERDERASAVQGTPHCYQPSLSSDSHGGTLEQQDAGFSRVLFIARCAQLEYQDVDDIFAEPLHSIVIVKTWCAGLFVFSSYSGLLLTIVNTNLLSFQLIYGLAITAYQHVFHQAFQPNLSLVSPFLHNFVYSSACQAQVCEVWSRWLLSWIPTFKNSFLFKTLEMASWVPKDLAFNRSFSFNFSSSFLHGTYLWSGDSLSSLFPITPQRLSLPVGFQQLPYDGSIRHSWEGSTEPGMSRVSVPFHIPAYCFSLTQLFCWQNGMTPKDVKKRISNKLNNQQVTSEHTRVVSEYDPYSNIKSIVCLDNFLLPFFISQVPTEIFDALHNAVPEPLGSQLWNFRLSKSRIPWVLGLQHSSTSFSFVLPPASFFSSFHAKNRTPLSLRQKTTSIHRTPRSYIPAQLSLVQNMDLLKPPSSSIVSRHVFDASPRGVNRFCGFLDHENSNMLYKPSTPRLKLHVSPARRPALQQQASFSSPCVLLNIVNSHNDTSPHGFQTIFNSKSFTTKRLDSQYHRSKSLSPSNPKTLHHRTVYISSESNFWTACVKTFMEHKPPSLDEMPLGDRRLYWISDVYRPDTYPDVFSSFLGVVYILMLHYVMTALTMRSIQAPRSSSKGFINVVLGGEDDFQTLIERVGEILKKKNSLTPSLGLWCLLILSSPTSRHLTQIAYIWLSRLAQLLIYEDVIHVFCFFTGLLLDFREYSGFSDSGLEPEQNCARPTTHDYITLRNTFFSSPASVNCSVCYVYDPRFWDPMHWSVLLLCILCCEKPQFFTGNVRTGDFTKHALPLVLLTRLLRTVETIEYTLPGFALMLLDIFSHSYPFVFRHVIVTASISDPLFVSTSQYSSLLSWDLARDSTTTVYNSFANITPLTSKQDDEIQWNFYHFIFRLYRLTMNPLITSSVVLALLNVAHYDALPFIDTMGLASRRLQEGVIFCNGALLLLGQFFVVFPTIAIHYLAQIVEVVINCLNPAHPSLRKNCLESATRSLCQLVHIYPMVNFHQQLQRIAVGTQSGIILIYDLRMASKWHVVQGHSGSIDVIAFNKDGDKFASYSVDDQTFCLWQLRFSSNHFAKFGSMPTRIEAAQVIHCFRSTEEAPFYATQQQGRPPLAP